LVTGTIATSASSVGAGVAAGGDGVGDALVSVSDGDGEADAVDAPGDWVDGLAAAPIVGDADGAGVGEALEPPVSAFTPRAATRTKAAPRIAGPTNRRGDLGRCGGRERR
jgi:hypothetical protein